LAVGVVFDDDDGTAGLIVREVIPPETTQPATEEADFSFDLCPGEMKHNAVIARET
jgi:hypothetical protein